MWFYLFLLFPVGCGDIIYGRENEIKNLNWPVTGNADVPVACRYLIVAPPGLRVYFMYKLGDEMCRNNSIMVKRNFIELIGLLPKPVVNVIEKFKLH